MAVFYQSDGRFSYTKTGEFRVRCKAETPLTIIFLSLIPVGDFLIFKLVEYLQLEMDVNVGQLLDYACYFWAGLCVFIMGAIRAGVTCKYYADQNEFKITDNHKHTEYLFYADITGIEYTPIKLFSKIPRGFRVKITTEYRTIVYDYLFFGNFGSTSPEDTPFHMLEQRAYACQEPQQYYDDDLLRSREDREGLL